MKKVNLFFVVIFIACALYMVAYADHLETIQAIKVQYPIIVDNVQVNNEIPMISIENRTYIPVRWMCDILNIGIEWKDEGKIEIITNKDQESTRDLNISKETAIKIADIIFAENFGQDFIEETQVSVEELDSTYKVYRSLKVLAVGGDGTIVINKKDGRIISIVAGE